MSLILYLVLATAISIQTINGQTIRSHIICDVDEVIVSVNSSGVIQHVQRDSSTSCTLLLSGFVSGSYVSIPGVDPEPSFGCENDTPVTINNKLFCVRGDQSINKVTVKLTNEQLNIILPSADVPDFELNYYSNVAVCGTDLKIPNEAEVNQLSGVISTSFDPSLQISLLECTVRLLNLPGPSVSVRFELLYMSGLSYPLHIRDKQFTPSDNKGSALLVATDSERDINVNYTSTESTDTSFVLNFTVLHCGDIPTIHVPYSTNSTTATPWLPGSMVTYVCVDGWKLKYDTNSTIKCIVDISREIAVWSDHSNIQCIPEPWCHSPPTAIDNCTYILSEDNLAATYQCRDGYTTNSSVSGRTINCTSSDKDTTPWTWSSPPSFVCAPEPWCHSPPNAIDNSTYMLSEDNLTATYQCIDGYTTDSSVSDRTINCTSSDKDTTPWTWRSPPSFVCTPVECDVTSEYENIRNGAVTDNRYYYGQQLQYQCDFGYMRLKGEVICTVDGSWSAVPACKNWITVAASCAGGSLLLIAIIVLAVCVYKQRVGKPSSKTRRNAELTVTEQGQDVPLDSVDEVSPYAITNPLPPINVLAASNRYPDHSATYADVQKIIGRPSPAPARVEHPTGPLYEEAPILPLRLEDKSVEMVDNNLYAAQGDVAPPQGAATAESVEMVENNLYGSGN